MVQITFLWDLFVYEHLPACMSVHHVYAGYAWKSEKDTESPGAGVTGNYESPCGS